MPIPIEELDTSFLLLPAQITAVEALQRLPADRVQRAAALVVLPARNGQFFVLRWIEVEAAAELYQGSLSALQLLELPGLPPPVAAIERDAMGLKAARALRDRQPGRRLAVTERGELLGLLLLETLLASSLPPDPFARERIDVARMDERGHAGPETALATDERVINAWIADLAPEQPLRLAQVYELCFNVDLPRADALSRSELPPDLFPAGSELVELLVLLESDDLLIAPADGLILQLPRSGRSRNRVTFNIEARHSGACQVTALFFARNRLVQRMTIGLSVEEPQAPVFRSSGRTLNAAFSEAGEQELSLTILPSKTGYTLIACTAGMLRAELNLSEDQLADLLRGAREDLSAVVATRHDGELVYQSSQTRIPEPVQQQTLQRLARRGALLYQQLFYAPGNRADAHHIGDLIRGLSRERSLRISIAAERFVFPWALLYDRQPLDLAQIDPEGFWGLRHELEYMPEFSSATPVSFVAQIKVERTLALAFVPNTGIDAEMGLPLVAEQRAFLAALAGVELAEFPRCNDFVGLLRDAASPAHLLYLYCHAQSYQPGERGGVLRSKLALSDGMLSLEDLQLLAPIDAAPLQQAPLVFLNACQSAELSPYLYDGLVPYLIARGARGVIGTEVDTPACFAAEFGREFLRRFASGEQRLGTVLRELRRDYCFANGNLLGLLYAPYASGDLLVQRVDQG